LAAALREGDIKIVRKLLRAGLKPHWAWVCETMRVGHLTLAEMLLESGAEKNAYTMAAMGDAAGLERRLRRVRADARLTASMEPASEGVTPLHVACASDWTTHGQDHMATQVRVAQILKRHGAKVNVPTPYRGIFDATPLFCACWTSRNLALVRWLLDHGAVARGAELMVALGYFQRHGKEAYDIAEYFLTLGHPVDGEPGVRTPLQAFAFQGTHRTVAWLIAHGADVNARGPGGRTAAHCAAQRNTGPKTLALLVDSGVDLTARDSDGQTPLDIAKHNRKDRLVKWITSWLPHRANDHRSAGLSNGKT
jgi:ankyrin repeat protein